MPKHPKSKGKLAKALSGQQAVAAKRAHEERARQAEEDRYKAIKAKIAAGGGAVGSSAKKRRISREGAAGAGAAGGDGGAAGGPGSAKDGAELHRKEGVQPFRRGEKVLLVGEGNFSFAHSLLLPHSAAAAAASSSTTSADAPAPAPIPLVTPSLLLCTAFDSLEVASAKYPDLSTHVDALRAAGATVLFGIDATKLDEYKEVREFAGLGKGKGKGTERELGGIEAGAGFDKIVFNFPHVGQGVTDQNRNVRLNQTLLIEFYRSAALLLRRGIPRGPGISKAAKRLLDPSAGTGANSVVVGVPKRERGRDVDADDDADEQGMFLHGDGDSDGDGEGSGAPDPTAQLDPPPPSTRGTVLVTLRTNAPYSLWLPQQLATKGALLVPSILPAHALKGGRALAQPAYRTVRSWAFEPALWEGYEHRRTIGFEEGRSSASNDDLVLTAKERKEKKLGSGAGEAAVSKGKDGKDKEDKAPIRTWELELVRKEDQAAMGKKGGVKRKAGGDPDLSD